MTIANNNTNSQRTSIFVSGQINNCHIPRMLVDTGSVATLCSEDFYNNVRDLRIKSMPTTESFVAADYGTLDVIAETTMTIIVANQIANHNVFVVRNFAYKFVLGNDFLKRNNCDILYSCQKLVINGQSTPIHNECVDTDFNSIVLSDNFTVNKHEEALLPGELHDPQLIVAPGETLLLEGDPTTANNFNVNFARVIVSALPAGIPVVVANTSNRNITIPKGTTVGKITKLHNNKQVMFAVTSDTLLLLTLLIC